MFSPSCLPAEQPILTTERLLLRPFTTADGAAVQRLAGAREIAATTLNIPHPYEPDMAEAWIRTHAESYATGRTVSYAVTRKADGMLIGAVGLRLNPTHSRAEMGYWVGLPFWNQGYTTEAGRAVLEFGFESLNLQRIFATHMVRNPASGRVMDKLGMTEEGILRQHLLKWGVLEDVAVRGILKSEWKS